MLSQSITVTQNALNRINSVIEGEDASNFRVYVTGGGCSGFSYGFKFDKEIAFDDDIINFENFTILLDSMSYPYLFGSSLDLSLIHI